jgi:TolA-binding protein
MDAVTYPHPEVADLLGEQYVPVKLDITNDAEAAQARELVPLWTPTVIIADGRGREVHREVGYLPPEDFLPALALGRAKGLFATARGDEAVRVLDEAIARYPQGEFAPQLLYWRGALGYSVSHDRSHLAEYFARVQREFPQSTWATRCSFFKPQG